MTYEIKQNDCGCHVETCNHCAFYLFKNGAKLIGSDDYDQLKLIADALNDGKASQEIKINKALDQLKSQSVGKTVEQLQQRLSNQSFVLHNCLDMEVRKNCDLKKKINDLEKKNSTLLDYVYGSHQEFIGDSPDKNIDLTFFQEYIALSSIDKEKIRNIMAVIKSERSDEN